ncbi:MAG: PAS domain-containing protein [Rhodospirillales bacterium]
MADALDVLFADSPVGIARLDRGGGIVGCNAVLAGILGNQPASLCGRALSTRLPPTIATRQGRGRRSW